MELHTGELDVLLSPSGNFSWNILKSDLKSIKVMSDHLSLTFQEVTKIK